MPVYDEISSGGTICAGSGIASCVYSHNSSGGVTCSGFALRLIDGLIDAWLLGSSLDGIFGRSALTVVGSTELFTTGKIAEAFNFDGTDYLELSSSQDTMNLGTDRTICFWINFADTGFAQAIMGDWGASSATRYWQIYFEPSWYVGGQPTIALRLSNGTTEYNYPHGIGNINVFPGTWYWISFRYNSATNEATVYSRSFSGSSGNSATFAVQSRDSAFRIGANYDGSDMLLDGTKLDAIHVWNRLLSNEELDYMYNFGAGRELLSVFSESPSGGVRVRGTTPVQFIRDSIEGTGGVEVSGRARRDYFIRPIIRGGVAVGPLEDRAASGGVRVSGSSQPPTIKSIIASGGIVSGGRTLQTPIARYSPESPNGGISVLGTVANISVISLSSNGGVIVGGGTEADSGDRAGTGGAIISGFASVDRVSSIAIEGGAIVSGSPPYSAGFVSSGGNLSLEGTSGVAATYFYGIEARWRVNQLFGAELTASWNVGLQPLSWYRVEGHCIRPTCENSGNDASVAGCRQGTFYSQTIAAHGIDDLCSKLKDDFLVQPVIWPLKSITRLSLPTYGNSNESCNQLIPEDFCQVPECREFCVNDSVSFDLAFGVFIQDQFAEYIGSGTAVLQGTATATTTGSRRSFTYLSSGSLSLSEDAEAEYSPEFEIVPSGTISVIDAAHVLSSAMTGSASGELFIVGSADVISPAQSYIGTGDIELLGSSPIGRSAIAVGGPVLSGASDLVLGFGFQGAGLAELQGDAGIISSAHSYEGTGDVLASGSADVESTDMGILMVEIIAGFTVVNQFVDLEETIEEEVPLSINSDVVSPMCNCPILPLTISFEHNLAIGNQLSKFLERNKLFLPSRLELAYHGTSNSWYKNYHLKGHGNLGDSQEAWNVIFDWSCPSNEDLDQEELGFWKLHVILKKENQTLNSRLFTRMLFVVPPPAFCSPASNSIQFSYNTKTKVTTSTRGLIELKYIEDELGLFNSDYWSRKPILTFYISSESPSTSSVNRYNIGEFFPTTIFS